LEGIETVVTHRYPGGVDPSGKTDTAWNPSQRVSIEQALVAYTSAGAYLFHEEHLRGSLAAGMSADLIVLSDNLFDLEPTKIHTARVELTMLEGKLTFEAARKMGR
jgi:predicted amidohydrolase YtcJ